ncbi:unnamed protein product [Angiostrongylus costaricensis]|uniref:Protein kinase domain-containing protein n=1 Tax=Angiostrongylus costaricensis TaxID=334426 RepID=A0A158PGH6_ANGCS|nr:unnamed protein product [Angiostrongylus costaricensis]
MREAAYQGVSVYGISDAWVKEIRIFCNVVNFELALISSKNIDEESIFFEINEPGRTIIFQLRYSLLDEFSSGRCIKICIVSLVELNARLFVILTLVSFPLVSSSLKLGFTVHRTEAATVRRRKSEAELGTDEALDCGRLAVDEHGKTSSEHDRPVQRRRRFTRKQRKSVTIDPETSLILATRRYSSSSEDDDQGSAIRSKPAERLSNTRALSVSVNILTPKEIVKTPRGPAARRAGRRSALLKSRAVAASTTNLDQLKTAASSLKWEGRSMSVRDLNGEEFDFSNKDSVTRWTSQILAELDSLPSSCIDLAQHEKTDSFSVFSQKTDGKNQNSSLKNGGLNFSPLNDRAGIKPPPVPPHRQSMCEPKTIVDSRCAKDKLMTSSVIEPMTSTFGSVQSTSSKSKSPVGLGVDMTSSVYSVDSWISSFETLMSSSFHDPISGGSTYSTTSSQNRAFTKDSEDSSATFVVSLSDSNGDETPQAFTPLPTEEAREFL